MPLPPPPIPNLGSKVVHGKRRRNRAKYTEKPKLPPPDLSRVFSEERECESVPLLPTNFNKFVRQASLRRARSILNEMHVRSMETLLLYEPLPMQKEFHKSPAKVRLNRGSNRSGKSQSSAAEMAWAVTGTHPWIKYPVENGIAYCVGYDLRHVGQVMWPMIGRQGRIKIIRDEVTKKWRAVRPWKNYDIFYKEKWRDAPPFLPERFIKGGYGGISWESRKDDIPKTVPLVNGWVIHFAGSKGAPQQGIELDLGWIDEEIENEQWYKELYARVSSRNLWMFWSATPLAATEQLYQLHQKAHDPHNDGSIEEFVLTIDDNPYIPEKKKSEFKAGLTPEEIEVRYYGNFALAGFKRYPEYRLSTHGIDPFTIPPDWTRYMVVDPGTTVCAVLFAAVPPSVVNDKPAPYELHIFDELYLKQCSAKKFAEEVSRKMGAEKTWYEAFIIDHQYGRQTESGIGKTVEEQYSEALELVGVRSHKYGYGFIRGSSDQDGRQESLRRLLQIRPDSGDTALKFHRDKSPKLDWEMQNQFFKKLPSGIVSDKRKPGIADHAVDCLEYLSAYNPQWVPPSSRQGFLKGVSRFLKAKRDKEKKKHGQNGISLGPPGEK